MIAGPHQKLRWHTTDRRRRRGAGELARMLRTGACQQRGAPGHLAPRVVLAGGLTSLAAPGGGEVQLAATLAALREIGVNAGFWRPWEDDLAGASVLHLFGSHPEHLDTIEAAHRSGARVALSPIAWFDLASRWHSGEPLARRIWNCGRTLAGRVAPRWAHWRRRLYEAADLLLPNSQAEADQLVERFAVPRSRICVVPNAAAEHFAQGDAAGFVELAGVRDFVLYLGRIEPRKNQLAFLRAMRHEHLPIVVLGDPVPAYEDYVAACRRAAGQHVRFVGRLAHDDPRLAGAYLASRCLALVSWFETPGLAALEAARSGTPLALTDRGATREYFGTHAHYASPGSPSSIRRAVLAAYQTPRDPQLARLVIEHYSWRAAAAATRDAYRSIL